MKGSSKDDELERYFYTVDEQGSTTLITNNSADIANEYYYDAFGNILESTEDVHNRITYTGQQFDSYTQQYYLRARFYNPAIGRFTQEDIYRGDGLNLYAYCKNNPVMYYDPSGYVCDSKKILLNTEGGSKTGNIINNLDTNNIPDMTKQDILNEIPDNWKYTEHNGFVHIKDDAGTMRIRIDPPDKVTSYPHVHVYDNDGNLLNRLGNIVDRKSPDGHIPYKN